jgi:hypothetical protein
LAAYISGLTDLNGDVLYPQTVVDAVYDENKVPLKTTLTEIDDEIARMKNTFAVTIPASGWSLTADATDEDMIKEDYVYSCRVSVGGITQNDNPKLFTNYISQTRAGKISEERALALIKDIYTFDGYIVAFAYQQPLNDVRINLSL